MDEAYASPSSDGHATLPSPTDSTFDLSLLPPPRKRRNRTTEPHVPTSSFINHAPTSHDSSSSDGDDEGDETFLRATGSRPWDGYQRMLPSSPEELHSQNRNGNSGPPPPRRLLLREKEAFGARAGNGRRASPPPRLTLGGIGPGRKDSKEEEEAEGSGAKVAGEVSRTGAVVDESIVRPTATATTPASAPATATTMIEDVTSTAIIPAGNTHAQNHDAESQPLPPSDANANTNRRSLVSQGPGIEPQYPIAGDMYGRRKGPGNQSTPPPVGGDAPRTSLEEAAATTGGANGNGNGNGGNAGNKAPGSSRSGTPLGTAPGGGDVDAASEQKPQDGNGRNKAPDSDPQRPQSTTNHAHPRLKPKPTTTTTTTTPLHHPAGEPPIPPPAPTGPPIPIPIPYPHPTARTARAPDPHTPANPKPKPTRKNPALAPSPLIPHIPRRRSASPQKRRTNHNTEPELPEHPHSSPEESFLGKTPRYLNWLNSSMDEGHAEPVGHWRRVGGVVGAGMGEESGFVGGDEDSGDDDGGRRSFFDDGDDDGEGDGEVGVMEEERLPMGGVEGYGGAGDKRRGGRGVNGSGDGNRKGKEKEVQNTVYHSLGEETTAGGDDGDDDDDTDSRLPPHPQQPHTTTSASSPTKEVEPSRKKMSPFDPTMPQFFSDPPIELPSTESPVKANVKPKPPPLTTTTTTTAATTNNNNIPSSSSRPSIAEIHKVPPPRSTTLIGKKSFNDLLLTSPTPSSPTSPTHTQPPSSFEPETDNPPDFSSLGSGFSFASIPARYKQQEFTPIGGGKVMGSSVASEETVGVGREGKDREGREDRERDRGRSKSDPVEIKAWMASKGLVVPMRVGETKEEQDRRSFSEEEEEVGRSVEYSEGESESEGARGNRHWSALQDFHHSSSTTTAGGAASKAPATQDDDDDARAHTPASINESKDLISELEGSSKTLWVRMAQAEAENNHFRKLLESNNIKIDDSFHDLSSSNLDMRAPPLPPPLADDSFDASTSEDVGSLRRRVMELEALLEIVARKETELRAENERKDNLVMHWRTQYNDVQKLALQNRQRALGLESHVKTLEQKAESHGREINKVVSKLSERGDVIKGVRQKSLGLEDRLAATEGQLRDAREALEEKERAVTQLREALERRRAFSGEGSAENLQEKLIEQQQAHDADTAKFSNLLEEKDGLVRHLQAELDEMVNLMPVDHGSSRLIDEEEVEDWLDEKSREISQYYDDGLDQIITELHGSGEREDFEDAVEEAEMSLRKVAEQAGLDEPLDKATLAAFGIRQLRTEHTLVKRLLAESEARVKDTAEQHEKMLRRATADMAEKLRASEEQRATAAKEAEAAADQVREKLAEAEQQLRALEADNEALEGRVGDSEERAAALEEEKEALRVLVNDTKRLSDMLKSQGAEGERRRAAADEEMAALRRQLAEEKSHVGVVETESIALRKRIAAWEEAAAAVRGEKEAVVREAKERQRVLEREGEVLRRQLDGAARAHVAGREAESERRVVRELQERVRALNETHAACAGTIAELEARVTLGEQTAQRIAAEKEFLKGELEVAVEETKAARGRFAQLLHDTAEKETRRFTFTTGGGSGGGDGGSGEEDPEACRRALHIIVTELERCALPAHIDLPRCDEQQIVVAEGVQDPELVRVIIGGLRLRARVILELDERGRRYKGAAKKHLRDAERRKGRVEELVAEVRELGVRLKAERRAYDEKMGQMILALRKGE
ncbi:uncharacterized protein LAJ45_04735 [Morchella importuna]|uniref:uncharacterized protein n=1 Tax=Morchella importuna TaxID=1174673 RepID=UPI001E8CCBED|nr:uncharacterized protein LAJ45_04735 [Morchella importuna]KAH8151034.1 hypothetical protein LAJ45_04735 [Morchella importuna]